MRRSIADFHLAGGALSDVTVVSSGDDTIVDEPTPRRTRLAAVASHAAETHHKRSFDGKIRAWVTTIDWWEYASTRKPVLMSGSRALEKTVQKRSPCEELRAATASSRLTSTRS